MEGTIEREGITVQKMSRWGIELQSTSHFFGELNVALEKGEKSIYGIGSHHAPKPTHQFNPNIWWQLKASLLTLLTCR